MQQQENTAMRAGHQGPDSRPVYVVDGSRTPFLKARGVPGPFTPVDLAVGCGRPLLLRQPFAPDAFEEVILGCVNPHPDEVNPARVAAVRLGCGEEMPAWTVQRNCGSGMQSLDAGFRQIRAGQRDLVLAGGTEALSHAPVLFSEEMVEWLGGWMKADSLRERLAQLGALRPAYLSPVIGLLRDLRDPLSELGMGQTAEILGHLFDIRREDADRYALESHRRLAAARDGGRLDEIEPLFDPEGRVHERDDGVRPDTSLDDLAALAPAFEKPFGNVTAGNSSQVTDGAAWLILASEAAVERHDLRPLARIDDSEWAALDPAVMGLGPVFATTPLLRRQGLSLEAVDVWEINEAFATQVLACLRAWEDDDFCRRWLGLDQALGAIDRDRLNVDGGAIALGHPVGTSGTRIVLHLVAALHANDGGRGIATECIGGGQGGAMLLSSC